MLKRTLSLCALLLAGCSELLAPVYVQILPSEYRVGNVNSVFATPVVNEVVRRKPRTVHLLMCLTTPPERVVQFDRELRARLRTKVTGSMMDNCPAP